MPIIRALLACLLITAMWSADDPLPTVPAGFRISVVASDPLIRNPAAIAFDTRGRMFVSQGPQYRNPTPQTPGDDVRLLIDDNGDGVADRAKIFATGFNCIQGLAWHGRDLWIANSPELTIVRDLDGDDEADEYVLVYGGLGNLEHAIHGLTWAPDGKLYLSKGNSRGPMTGERIAPKPFRELWGTEAAAGTPDLPAPKTFMKGDYRHGYHHPEDDWGREGGVLRCDDLGANLEIVSRGLRNPWDIAFDDGFTWLGTDQDQDPGDRIFSPFMGAHFGWGHRWSAHWTGEHHLPTAPISGPLFHGSGTGVVFCTSPAFPPAYRGVFFINDWLKRQITVYRPRWDGALMQSDARDLEVFAAVGKGRTMGESSGTLFDVTDLEVGPDGALYVLSWGHRYGLTLKDGQQVDEGRVYRIGYGQASAQAPAIPAKHAKPMAQWTVAELIDDLRHDRLPVWRSNAQDELVRRGAAVVPALSQALSARDLPPGAETWIAWTLGRIAPGAGDGDAIFAARVAQAPSTAARVQALRILAQRIRDHGQRPVPATVVSALGDPEPRVRFAAVDAIAQARQSALVERLHGVLAGEADRLVFYRAWRALAELSDSSTLRRLLVHDQAGVRLGALLALLEGGALTGDEVVPLRLDRDPRVAGIAASFVAKTGTSAAPVLAIEPKAGGYSEAVSVRLTSSVPGTEIRYTTDGSVPTSTAGTTYHKPVSIERDTTVRAALFRARESVGPVLDATYRISAPLARVDSVPLTQVQATSRRVYRLASDGLQAGGRVYSDRDYTWIEVPKALRGATTVMTSNEDDASMGAQILSFRVDQAVEVFIAYDQRLPRRPDWMAEGTDGGFTATPFTMRSQDATYTCYRKRFAAGEIVLGGNLPTADAPRRSHYIVVVTPAVLGGRTQATTMADVLPLVAGADRDLGRRLFYGVATCSACHRVGTQGAIFAPDLTDIGSRADAKALTEAILDPNVAITEGFQQVNVTMRDGQNLGGVVREESDLSLTLVQGNGKPVEVRKADITGRVRSAVSLMPGTFPHLLDPAQVAAITAWLLDQRADRAPAASSATEPHARFTITPEGDDLRVDLDGALFTRYRSAGLRSPVLHPLIAPGGINVVRDFPLVKSTAGEVQDHNWHTALWFSHGAVDGLDFWRDTPATTANRVVPSGPPRIIAGSMPSIVAAHDWRAGDGRVVCRDRRVIRFSVDGDTRAIDYQVTWCAPADRELVLGDTEEGTMAIRTHPALALTGAGARGSALNSAGVRGKDVWGKRAAWVDYWAPFGNSTVGVAMLDHPGNPRHPTWWHARDYGLVTANPFGIHDFEGKPAGTGDLRLAAGQELTFRWRFVIHRGNAANAGIAERYAAFASEPQALPMAQP